MIKKHPITNLDTLNEAYDYEKPSAFSRGMRVEIAGASFLFISGTASIDENGKTVHQGDFAGQVQRTYLNIRKLLEAEGATWKDVVKTTVYIKDIAANYEEFNRLRLNFFKDEGIMPFPASVGVQATLCREDLLVEMDALAIISK